MDTLAKGSAIPENGWEVEVFAEAVAVTSRSSSVTGVFRVGSLAAAPPVRVSKMDASAATGNVLEYMTNTLARAAPNVNAVIIDAAIAR
jgi:hypothetical protein